MSWQKTGASTKSLSTIFSSVSPGAWTALGVDRRSGAVDGELREHPGSTAPRYQSSYGITRRREAGNLVPALALEESESRSAARQRDCWTGSGPSGRTRSSWLREVMPSLEKILRRW